MALGAREFSDSLTTQRMELERSCAQIERRIFVLQTRFDWLVEKSVRVLRRLDHIGQGLASQ